LAITPFGQKYYLNVDDIGAVPYAKLEEEIADYLINDVQNGFSRQALSILIMVFLARKT